jgi:hypothetical protein
MLALASAIVLGCMLVMFIVAGNQLDKQLDDRAAQIERSFEADLNRIREDVRRELEAQPPAATPVPTATPFDTPTPVPTETATPAPTDTPGAGDATATPTAPIQP